MSKIAAFIDFQGTLGGTGIDAKGILVLTGVGKGSLNEYRHTWKDVEVASITENILEAAKWIIFDSKGKKEAVDHGRK